MIIFSNISADDKQENKTSQCQFLKEQPLPWFGQITSDQVTYQVQY